MEAVPKARRSRVDSMPGKSAPAEPSTGGFDVVAGSGVDLVAMAGL